ncbi:MAG TPA: DUF4013 domain-containing protein [Candidatus Nanoarchaeia archaeon]|nr:DUF4013 domain-containing protein [Candidatus Nanoarchaeia archaeon]
MSYLKAFQRPFQDLKKLTLGAILSGIPVLNVLTGLFVTGYTAECARLTFHQKNNLPEWKNFLELFKNGFFVSIIWIVYCLPLFLVLLILLFRGVETFLQETNPEAFTQHLLQQNTYYLLLLAVLFLLTWYIALGAVFRYITHYRFKDAFQINTLLSQTFNPPYFKAWSVAFLYTLLISVVLQALFSTFKSENILLGLVYNLFAGYLTFIAATTSMTIVGEAWKNVNKKRH